MPTGPARSGRPDDKLRMVEGACSQQVHVSGRRPSTPCCTGRSRPSRWREGRMISVRAPNKLPSPASSNKCRQPSETRR